MGATPRTMIEKGFGAQNFMLRVTTRGKQHMMTDSLENCMKPNSASVHFLVRAANNGFRETLDNQSVNMNPRISQKIAST